MLPGKCSKLVYVALRELISHERDVDETEESTVDKRSSYWNEELIIDACTIWFVRSDIDVDTRWRRGHVGPTHRHSIEIDNIWGSGHSQGLYLRHRRAGPDHLRGGHFLCYATSHM